MKIASAGEHSDGDRPMRPIKNEDVIAIAIEIRTLDFSRAVEEI